MQISNKRRWSIVGLLFAAGFINYLDRAILSVALPRIAGDLGLGPEAKGVLLSAFFWSYAVMQLPMGWLSDRVNMRWFYAGAFALWSLSCGFTGFAATLGALLALRVLLGVGEAVYLPGGIRIVSLILPPSQQGLASGLVNSGTRLGLAIGAPLVAWMIVSAGWQRAFFISGFAGLIWLVPWLLVCPSRLDSKPRAIRLAVPGRPRWLNRNLLGLCLGHIGFSYYWYLLVTWLPDYLVESRHIPLQQAGLYAMVPYLVFSIAEPLGGWIADRFIRRGWDAGRTRKGIVTFAFLTSVMLIPAGRASSDGLAVCFLGAAALAGLATGNILAMLQRVAPPQDVGLWTGILNFCGNLSGIAAPLATGVLIARTGSYFPGFVLAVVVILAGIPAYWLIVGDMKAEETAAASAE